MNAVQIIKDKHDMNALLRTLTPKMEENARRRREAEATKQRFNAAMAKVGFPLRVVK